MATHSVPNFSKPEFPSDSRAPWLHTKGVRALLTAWAETPKLWRNIKLDATLPSVAPRPAPIPPLVPANVRQALAKRGICELFSHQAASIELACGGGHVVIATPTASGKSICYNLPVLTQLSVDPSSCALYLFPTKALARDQEEALRTLLADAALGSGAIAFDGDTPGDARRAARQKSGVILSNPDMLHAGILPHHALWARFFANLRYVVIDELHTYRGVFGSHLANVLRRLRRVAHFHGSNPTFIFASATIGNPQEHASRMLGDDVALVAESGAPQGERRILLYNPPVLNAELGVRESYVKAAVKLTAQLVRAEIPTLVFGQSRNNVEVMLKYLRDRLKKDGIGEEQIHGYRGGYLPQTRRQIEAGLRQGTVRCVVATNALELGIDIGMLDAVVCAGYPGTVAGLWQRFGRAGRRGGTSLAVLVASSAPYDQFFATYPDVLLAAGVEHARIDPDNIDILLQHLKCAAFELPFTRGESFGDVPPEPVADALGYLVQKEVLHAAPKPSGQMTYHWASDAYPANHVSLRSIGWDNFVIIEEGGADAAGQTIGEMDWRSAHTMLHEQAIYQHQGGQFQVEKLDFDNHKAFVRKVDPDYYTEAMTYTRVCVLDEEERQDIQWQPTFSVAAGMGEVSVIEQVVGYKKIKYHTHENVGYGEVHLPEMQMHTMACWFTVSQTLIGQLPFARPAVIDALRGFAKALHTVAVVGLMIDPRDLGHTLGEQADESAPPQKIAPLSKEFDPTVFLYDSVPGGVGLAPRLFEQRQELWQQAHRLVIECQCAAGCPTCIGPSVGGGIEVGTDNAFEAVSELQQDVPRKSIVLALLGTLGLRGLDFEQGAL